jgi:hypothetical protein
MNARSWIAAAALAAAISLAAVAEEPAMTVDGLGWMAGAWRGEIRAGQVEETWSKPAGGSMLATCRIVSQGKTVFREFMLLEQLPDGIFLTVRHVGERMKDLDSQMPVFKLVSNKDGEAVFQTAEEKPRRIIYRKQPDGGLLARVETFRQGRPAVLEFPLKAAK